MKARDSAFRHPLALVALPALLSSLMGCGEPTDPKGAVVAAEQAARDGNLDRFKSLLRDEALRDYGNPDAMETVRRRIESYPDLQLAEPQPISAPQSSPTARTGRYEVDVYVASNPSEIVYRLLVGCDEAGQGQPPRWTTLNCWISGIR